MIRRTRRNNKRSNKTRYNKRSELKIVDTANSATVSTAFVVIPLVEVQQGTALNERVGYSITPKDLDVRLKFDIGAALIGSPNSIVRILVVKDNQQIDSTSPAGLDVLSTADPVSQRNYFNQYRFSILKDTSFNMDQYHPVLFKKMKLNIGTFIRYSGAGLTSVSKNGIYLIMISNNTANPPTVSWWNRIRFTDD